MKNLRKTFLYVESRPGIKWKWVLLILIIVFIPHLYISYSVYLQTTMPDLYMKIIGSRLYSHGLNPYFYVWKPGDPISLFNPNYFEQSGLNGVTVTPFFLWLQTPLSKLIFCDAKNAWWIIMEVFLFATIFISLLIPKNILKQILVLVISIFFFLFSRNWWLHVYNGQYYVLFAFVFSISGYWTVKKSRQNFTLWFYPIISLVRPFFFVSLLPMLIKKTFSKAKYVLTGSLIAVVLLLFAGNLNSWKNYKMAMNAYGVETITPIKNKLLIDHRAYNVPLEDCVKKIALFPVTKAGCLFGLQHYLLLFGISISESWIFPILLLISIASFLFMVIKRADVNNPEIIFLASFFIYILCELFTPAPRNPYNMIQYAGMIGVLVNKGRYKMVFLAIIGLALNHDFPFRFNYQREIGELFLLASIIFTILTGKRKLST